MMEICRALEIRIKSSADLEDKKVKPCLLWYYKSLTYYIVVKNKEKECKRGVMKRRKGRQHRRSSQKVQVESQLMHAIFGWLSCSELL
jgi:hypothetical protein